MKKLLLFFFIFALLPESLVAQDCPCDPVSEINICYLPWEQYCPTSCHNCGLTLNCSIQEVGITQKLLNPDNFGPDGISPCRVNLVPIENLTSSSQINDNNCDIFYVGNYPKDSLTFTTDAAVSLLSEQTLNEIYAWSTECSQNLAIVPQAEAKIWGYTVEDENDNPNFPIPGANAFFAIFDGPFGIVSNFNQGGFFQGIITSTPASGFTPLAMDEQEKPTLVLDHATNDLIIGDIGYFSSMGGGALSEGDQVLNNNDRLACNIFALGCDIANGDIIQHQSLEICNGGFHISPSGAILTEEGNYLDTLFSSLDCDTIINTQITVLDNQLEIIEELCSGDPFEVLVGSTTYNENNPVGTELLVNSAGCDSMVTVQLNFLENSELIVENHYCVDEQVNLVFNNVFYNNANPSGVEQLMNAEGCDSFIYIDLVFDLEDELIDINLQFCEGSSEQIVIGSAIFTVNSSSATISVPGPNCDTIYDVSVEILENSTFIFDETICKNTNQIFTINGTEYGETNLQGFEIIPNDIGCDSFITIELKLLEDFISVFDEHLCANDFSTNFEINGNSYNLTNPVGQENFIAENGCDSTVLIDLQIEPLAENVLEVLVCPNKSIVFEGSSYTAGSIDTFIYSRPELCDSQLIVSFVESELNFPTLDTLVVLANDSDLIPINIPSNFSSSWEPQIGLSCNDCPAPSYSFEEGLENYQLSLTDENGCVQNYNLEIFKLTDPYIPDAFSPNKDGINDYFEIFFEPGLASTDIQIVDFQLFDRWGNLVKSIQNENWEPGFKFWDGRFKKEKAIPGVYVFTLNLEFLGAHSKSYSHSVTLLN